MWPVPFDEEGREGLSSPAVGAPDLAAAWQVAQQILQRHFKGVARDVCRGCFLDVYGEGLASKVHGGELGSVDAG